MDLTKMVIRFSKKFMEKFGKTVHEGWRERTLVRKIVYYFIDWRNRKKATNLQKWVKKQIDNPSPELVKLANNLKADFNDLTMINILRWVMFNAKYISDKEKWDTPEYWETAEIAYKNMEFDCETGSVLMLVLARLAGIPHYQIRQVAGTVKTKNGKSGHSFLVYQSDINGIEYAMDWCFYPDDRIIPKRTPYLELDYYLDEWFSFNDKESFGYRKLR